MTALLDSGSQSNYISSRAVWRAGLKPQRKKDPYPLRVANGEPMPQESEITHEVSSVPMTLSKHHEEIDLDVFGMATHDIILGLPWLRKHNPKIDWVKRTLSLDCDHGTPQSRPAQLTMQLADEKEIATISSTKTRQDRAVDRTDTDDSSGHEVTVKEKRAPPTIPDIYRQYARMFEEELTEKALPEHKPWDHEIKLQEGKTPTFERIYQLSEKELKVLREYITENLKKGFIRRSESPAGYPIMFVPKKDGKLRPCIDFRKLNEITIKNRYPLPNISELQDRLAGARYFTALDLRGAYNLIRMKEGEEWKTAFRTRYGLYEYLVMPFGLTNAPATCQELVNNVLRTHLDQTVVAYLDDILVYSKTLEEHITHVTEVLECLKKADLQLKPEKCEWHKEEVEFLGYIVGRHGVKMSPTKIEVVKSWQTPTTVKQIQEFLGFVNFNRRFIKDYSLKALPLTKLTRKDIPFKWEQAQENAFQALKQACMEPPTLATFRSNEPLRMETDASDLALGACITQEKDGQWHPIAYYSRKFSGPEERYDVHDKELLAIVSALEHWRVYAESCSELTIYTDHKNLVHFTTTKVLNRRQVRWSEMLGQYKFKILYTPGKDNGRADALSRRHDLAGSKTINESAILGINKDGSLGPSQQLNNMMLVQQKQRVPAYVPEELEQEVISSHHDDPLHGHPGITRTMELIKRHYEFPNMKDKISKFIKQCVSCQQNKHSTHAKYGEAQAMEPPTAPWTNITMDFVTQLPVSKDPVTDYVYDSIFVVVDRFTKAAEFVPFRHSYTAEQLARVFLDRIVRHHGIPESIISDRDKLFTSNYWTTLLAAIGTKKKLSTAYHPQTDGQTERVNQTMETYLRIYCNQQQDNWVSLLPMAQIAYNNKLSEATGVTPFFANHGRHPNLFTRSLDNNIQTDSAISSVQKLKEVHQKSLESIAKAQSRAISYVNKKRKTAPLLKEGDKVYLLTKNLRTRRPTKKLDKVKVGPFFISKQISPVNFRLELPKDAKIHPVFHISLLEPADAKTPVQKDFHYQADGNDEWEVEKIIQQRRKGRRQEYLVKWLGYPDSENTWEPATHLTNCQQLLKEFGAASQAAAPSGQSRNPLATPQRHPRC
jgi:transposase InsO family protein